MNIMENNHIGIYLGSTECKSTESNTLILPFDIFISVPIFEQLVEGQLVRAYLDREKQQKLYDFLKIQLYGE